MSLLESDEVALSHPSRLSAAPMHLRSGPHAVNPKALPSRVENPHTNPPHSLITLCSHTHTPTHRVQTGSTVEGSTALG